MICYRIESVSQCIGASVLATGSKVYLETAWDIMRQCKIRLCSSEETLFAYVRIPGMSAMKEMNAKNNESRARNC